MSDTEHDQPPQQLPLDAWHRRHGARMVPFAGYEMPIQYEGIMAEHLWTRASAGLFDVSHMGQLALSGEGVDTALEALLPAELKALPENRIRYSLLLDEEGGILDDLMVTRLPSDHPFVSSEVETRGEIDERVSTALDTNGSLYVVVNGATKLDDIAHLREHLPDEVTLNHMEDHALLAVQGPKAVDAVERLVPGVATLGFMQAGAFAWQGTDLWISRSGYTGEDGFEISVPADHVSALADALVAEPEVKPIGLGARDSLRLEAGLPLYGHDLSPETTPVAADLGFALSKRRREEGGFMGADRVLAEHRDGAATRRVGLAIDGRQPVREGAAVVDEGGAEIGRVTSGGFAPSLGGPVAMAYVPADQAAPGTRLDIEVRGRRIAATVTSMPFVPHRYVRKGAAK